MQEETARSAIDTFISAFNASDDSYVTALLSQALTSDVVFWGPLGRSEGIEAVERFVLDIRRHPAGTGTMVRCSAVDMPDEWARYQWVFTTPDGGPRLAGTDVVHLRRSLIDQVIVFAGRSSHPPPESFSSGAVLLLNRPRSGLRGYPAEIIFTALRPSAPGHERADDALWLCKSAVGQAAVLRGRPPQRMPFSLRMRARSLRSAAWSGRAAQIGLSAASLSAASVCAAPTAGEQAA